MLILISAPELDAPFFMCSWIILNKEFLQCKRMSTPAQHLFNIYLSQRWIITLLPIRRSILHSIHMSYQTFCCVVSLSILLVVPYYGEPVGRVKIQTTSQNSQRYYKKKRPIRNLLSNTPKWYVPWSEFRGYLFTGNA